MAKTWVIRIHWGYWTFYVQEPFHHVEYSWDGQVGVENGSILHCGLLEFGGVFGPCRERVIPLDRPSWHWGVNNGYNHLGGVLFEVEGGPESVVHFSTRTTDLKFTIRDLLEKKVINKHVGSRYSCAEVTALLDGYDPNLDDPEDIEASSEVDGVWRRLILADAFSGGTFKRWFRTDWVWIPPGQSIEVDIPAPGWKGTSQGGKRALRTTFRCASAIPEREGEIPSEVIEKVKDTWSVPYRVSINNQEVESGEHYFSTMHMTPLMDELVVDLSEDLLNSDTNKLQLHNDGKHDYLIVARLFLEEVIENDIEVDSCPRWVLLDDEFEIVLNCRSPQRGFRVELPSGITPIEQMPDELDSGEHRFRFRAQEPLAEAVIKFNSEGANCQARIDQVMAAHQEDLPMRVGLETKIIPAEVPGMVESLLKEMKDTQLGDFIVFRFAQDNDQVMRWGRLCKEYGIYHLIEDEWANVMQPQGGSYFVGRQFQEFDGTLWGYIRAGSDAATPRGERTMRTAYEDYLSYMGNLVSIGKKESPAVTAVESISAIGHNLAYLAGLELCLAQFNKTHNVLLLADARGAARTHKKPVWGCYIAEGAHKSPEGEEILRMFWLALHIAYICGASSANEEECSMRNYHERLYAKGDRFPRIRQDIIRSFNRYVKTHPRRGEIKVKQALLIGRFACDVVDGMADSEREGIPRMVWRRFGADEPAWQHWTPEYGLRYLDVFFPGVWLQSLVQSPEKVRRWYSGTPQGEIELIPIEASGETLSQFNLLLLLGWNSMNEEIYGNLKDYVQDGGRVFMSVPHLTTNETRDFLWNNMDPLNLLRDGEIDDLFGAKITGRGDRLSSIRMVDELNEPYRISDYAPPAGPKHPPVDLVEVELRGAEVLAIDRATEKPVLIRHRLGEGEAYLLLTHDFPGNSWLADFLTQFIRRLSNEVPSRLKLEDPSGDVYYTHREEETGLTRVHLLNTDWTEAGNRRLCSLWLDGVEIPLIIKEGRLSEVIWFDKLAILIQDEGVYIETVSSSTGGYSLKLHGFNRGEILLRNLNGKSSKEISFEGRQIETTDFEGWEMANIDFKDRSIGELIIKT